jgi:DNA repair protein RecO (recombination protein O)
VAAYSSEAIVLSAIRYGETSKIVRLAMPHAGVLSTIAKGALRPKSRFGAALQVLSRGTAQVVLSRHSDLHQLVAFDATHIPLALSKHLERYAAALALADLLQRCSAADQDPAAYQALRQGLHHLETAPAAVVEATALRALWRLVSALGFAPRLESCVMCDTLVPPQQPLHFSAREGGALCPACHQGRSVAVLAPDDRTALQALLSCDAPLPTLDRPHAAAHRRLVGRFIEHQVAEGATLRALDFWLAHAWERA